MCHLPDTCFVAGVETVRAVELSRDDFSLFEEPVDQQSSIPVGGVRMAIGDDLIRRVIEAFSTPFAIEAVEVEPSLLGKRECVPLITEFKIDAEFALWINHLHKIDERFILPFL